MSDNFDYTFYTYKAFGYSDYPSYERTVVPNTKPPLSIDQSLVGMLNSGLLASLLLFKLDKIQYEGASRADLMNQANDSVIAVFYVWTWQHYVSTNNMTNLRPPQRYIIVYDSKMQLQADLDIFSKILAKTR